MDISSVNSDLIRGNVTTIILSSLITGDRYGYDILKEIESKSEGQYKLKQPTLYSVLKRLEKQGFIESYLGEPEDTGGGRRRYYKLTDEGHDTLNKEKSEYEFSRTILDKLVSDTKFDLENDEPPFNVSDLRPYTKKKDDNDGDEKVASKTSEKTLPEIVEKIVVKEKVIVKYIDSATGKVFDGNISLANFEQANSSSNILEQAKAQDSSTMQSALQSQQAQGVSTMQTAQQGEQNIVATAPPKQELSPIMQVISNNQTENSAFTNRQTSLGEEKDNHPLSPHKTLLEVFQSIEKPTSTEPTAETAEIAVRLQAQKSFDSVSHEHASLLDILAQKEEERERLINAKHEQEQLILAKKQTAADVDEVKTATQSSQNSTQTQYTKQQNEYAQNAQQTHSAQPYVQIAQPEPSAEYVASYVLPRKKEEFSFEKQDIDYKSVFGNITARRKDNELPLRPAENENQLRGSDSELKTRLYAKGYKVRPYTKANTAEYYSFNFILSNRLSRDSFSIILLCFVAMIGIMWSVTAAKVGYSVYLSYLAIGLVLYGIPLGMFFANPSKRVRANFNFKLSILNRTMLCIELAVIVMLIGFFLVGADVNNINTMIAPIIVPIVLLLNLPLSSIVYYALYRTKKYHIA